MDVQVVTDGKDLTVENLVNRKLSPSLPILVEDGPKSIGMTVPKYRSRNITVRDIADTIGHSHPVSVIDVRHQEELEGWTLGDLVDYFEDEDRLNRMTMTATASSNVSSTGHRRRRAAAALGLQRRQEQSSPKVLNQISLEFSWTPLHNLVRSPQFVRDMDWIDHAWPRERRQKGDYPVVQYYCLTSTAGCYTDFHVDFGGSAVWYHILSGEKHFVLIAPTKANLEVYEDWLCRSNQSEVFLPDLISDGSVVTVTLKASQTLVIPTGWIHGVYTPVDSIVIGGNFLHGLDIPLQLQIYYLEIRTRVPDRFRFPHYLPLMFYAGGMYLSKLRRDEPVYAQELEGLEDLIGALEGWWKLKADDTIVAAAQYIADTNGCKTVEESIMLLKLQRARHAMKQSANNEAEEQSERPKLRLKLPLSIDAKSNTISGQAKPPSPQAARSSSSAHLQVSSPPDSSKPSSPLRIRLSPKEQESLRTNELDYRISVPSNSQVKSLAKKRKPKEDLDEYVPLVEDEWKPEVMGRQKRTKGPKVASSAAIRSKAGVPKKPSMTARQRLMKRCS